MTATFPAPSLAAQKLLEPTNCRCGERPATYAGNGRGAVRCINHLCADKPEVHTRSGRDGAVALWNAAMAGTTEADHG